MHLLRSQMFMLCSWLWGFFYSQGGYLAVRYGQGSTSVLLLVFVSYYNVVTADRMECLTKMTDMVHVRAVVI